MSFAGTESAGETADNFETFDNFESNSEPESNDEDWTKEEPEVKKVKEDEGMKVLKDTDVDSDGEVVDDEDAPKKKEPKKEKEKEEEEESFDDEESEEEEEEEDPKEEKKESKKLRIRMADGELYNIDADSSFKMKIDGEFQDVPMQELINNYAGKTAWDKKFTEIGKEKKSIELERNTLKTQKDELMSHLQHTLGPIKDPNKNPMESLMYLVEMSGEDPYTTYRRLLESNLEEISNLTDMTETERELYFHKKKDELHSNVARKRNDRLQKEATFNQVLQKVDSLRQAYNVSEDDFADAADELEEIYKGSGLDVNSITNEDIVDYSSLKPHISKVKELIVPYEDNIAEAKYGDVVAQLSRNLRDGNLGEKELKEILKRNFSVEEDVKELNTKVYQKSQKNSGKKVALKETENSSESFDDWEI